MTEKRVVLVTGVASHWGARVATQLMAEPDLRVIGLDTEPPQQDIKGLDFIQADIRNPLGVGLTAFRPGAEDHPGYDLRPPR